jgi:hypothetical protein
MRPSLYQGSTKDSWVPCCSHAAAGAGGACEGEPGHLAAHPPPAEGAGRRRADRGAAGRRQGRQRPLRAGRHQQGECMFSPGGCVVVKWDQAAPDGSSRASRRHRAYACTRSLCVANCHSSKWQEIATAATLVGRAIPANDSQKRVDAVAACLLYVTQEKPEGALMEQWGRALSDSGLETADISAGLADVFSVGSARFGTQCMRSAGHSLCSSSMM